MKIRSFSLGLLLSVILIICTAIKSEAVPYSGLKKASSTFDLSEISRKEMENKLGRKMKWKERFAFRWMKKQIKKKRKRDVVIIGLDNNIVKGNLIKANKDSLYLINFDKEKIPGGYYSYLKNETLVLPVNQIKKINLLNIKRMQELKNPILIFTGAIVGGLIALPFTGKMKNNEDDRAFLETLLLTFVLFILAIVLSVLLIFNSIPKTKMLVKGNPDKLDLDALSDYIEKEEN